MQEAGTLARYVPFDVSDDFLRDAAATLAEEYRQTRHPRGRSATSTTTWARSRRTDVG